MIKELSIKETWFNKPQTGTALAVLSGLSFLFLCMVLPLVGRSGSAAPHHQANFVAFLTVLLVSLGLSMAATMSKRSRSRIDGSPAPVWSMGLTGLLCLLLVCLFTGLLRI